MADHEKIQYHKKMDKIFYNINPFGVDIDLDDDNAPPKKNQVILFVIHDLKHIPIISFCYEDVCEVPQNQAMHECEIYTLGSQIKRDDKAIYITMNMMNAFDINVVFDLVLKGPTCTSEWEIRDARYDLGPLNRIIFNDYKYLEKTIIKSVEEHEDHIDQLIKQVKKITKFLANSVDTKQ